MGGVGSAVGGLIGGISAKNEADRAYRAASQEQRRREAELNSLEQSRQPIVNPYANYSDLSDMAANLGDMVSNPYANMGVATQAAKMQAEEADISLANTLDTIRATGAGAGGATALAQAALRSKKGVAASIEQQEAQNEKLAAQGQQNMERLQMQEAQRVQAIQISEGQRLQAGEAAGADYTFRAREGREVAKMDRVAALADRAYYEKREAKAASQAAFGNIMSGVGGLADSLFPGGI